MNTLLFWAGACHEKILEVRETEKLTHIQNILKLETGDSLKVGEINGKLGRGKILKKGDSCITLDITLEQSPPPPLPCSVILALPRPQQLKRILLHLSSLGVKDIHLIQTQKVEKNYWQSPKLRDIQNYLLEGLEQANDTMLPHVQCHQNFRQFIRDGFPNIRKGKQVWLAHPGSSKVPEKQYSGEHVLVIGPEGGFTENEVEQFRKQACYTVSLGQRILKSETAVPLMLGSLFDLP